MQNQRRNKTKSEKPKESVVGTPAPAVGIPGPGDDIQEPVFRPVSSSASSATGQDTTFTGQAAQALSSFSQTGPVALDTGSSVPHDVASQAFVSSDSAGTGIQTFPDQVYRDPPVQHASDDDFSDGDLF